jgi:hypothetical protein
MQVFDKFGKVRQLKEQVVGLERIPDDPLQGARDELAEYEVSVQNFRKSIDRFELIMSDLGNVSAEVSMIVANMNPDAPNTPFSFTQGLLKQKIEPQFENLKSRTDQLVAMHAGLAQRLRDRDRAYFMKLHYEEKVNKLQTGQKGFFSKLTDTAKLTDSSDKAERNDKKLEEATAEWLGFDDQCRKEVADALNNLKEDVDQLVNIFQALVAQVYMLNAEKFKSATDQKYLVAADEPESPPAVQAPSKPVHVAPAAPAVAAVSASASAPAATSAGTKADGKKDYRALLGVRKAQAATPISKDDD